MAEHAADSDAERTSAGGRIVRDRLADGRDIVYFDDAGSDRPAARAADARELPPRPATAQMRRDPLTGDWISVAAARQHRAFLPPAELDPLAPASPTNPSEVPDDYDVVVFENRSPSFGPELAGAPAAHELHASAPSGGRCEVVCFSPAHEGSFGTQTRERARTVIEAWAHRTAEIGAMPGIAQVFPFENRGVEIGVTLHHPHGQIYAYPYVTPRTSALVEQARAYNGDLFADILDAERAGPRVVIAGTHWTAFVPFAARWPVEVHLLPNRHVPDLAATTEEERAELAVVYLRLLRGIDRLYDGPTPYIAAWHQAPTGDGREDVRLMLQLTSPRRAADRLKFLAGSEAAMGAWVADIPPETGAERLVAAIATADREDPV